MRKCTAASQGYVMEYSRRALILSASGLIQAARLKAVGVESVVVDRLARPGDNWATRYDSLRFHIGKSSCNPPFLRKALVQNAGALVMMCLSL